MKINTTLPSHYLAYVKSIPLLQKRTGKKRTTQKQSLHPFWAIVQKEVSDHIGSWRFIILLAMITLICFGSLYIAVNNLPEALANAKDPNRDFVFLKLLSASDGTLPPFHILLGFLGPLLGIGMGFDAVNSEQNSGTLVRLMAQPIHRDYFINAKFTGALMVIGTLFMALSFLITGLGILVTGQMPMPEEFLRIIGFIILCIIYVAFWLNLSILFSVKFKRAATSALTAIAVWLFFTIFYQILVGMAAKALVSPGLSRTGYRVQKLLVTLLDIAPNRLFTDATTTILVPSVRSLGPLSIQQMQGAIPSTLSLGDSLMVVWPQLTGLIAATVACFAFSYYLFMRKEIRS
ncbi:ABC transporter permease [Sinomicrobium pectinilyticum]|uniref:ABC transporter permease n=1 Tax=Sinomicrobium pectinilyticum TaxID=1084421 RepID=A0A3N0EB22_SINP1|nr:ABC transporter permease [Sinomicrobium pectinilyticum]RNL84949.1 ABC transporter permease [Sinomicrobium pectinilyticum]